jgi:hypothetical protein
MLLTPDAFSRWSFAPFPPNDAPATVCQPSGLATQGNARALPWAGMSDAFGVVALGSWAPNTSVSGEGATHRSIGYGIEAYGIVLELIRLN